MSEQHRGAWGVRDDQMWWPGAATAADQQTFQQHQHLIHQQQIAQQQHDAIVASSASPATTHQLFSYKMANSFQNPATTVSVAAATTSPTAGVCGYDYRLGGGAPTMPAPAAQWWYPPATVDNSMHNQMQNMQQNMQQQTMPPVQTPPPPQSDAQARQEEVQRHQEAHRHQQEAAQRQQEAHRQHQEAQRHHQEVQRHHQEAQRQQQVEAQQAAIQQHHQALAEAQARQQLQQQQLQQQQLQQQTQNNHHQQHQQVTTVLTTNTIKGRMPRGKGGDSRPRGRMTAYAFFVQTCREEHKKKHPEENVVFAEFSKKCAERWKTMLDKEKKRFHEMAEGDKKRYDDEMKNYTPPKGEKQRGKKRKQIKDPNAPKRSLSAFFWFSNDERAKVKGQNPEYGVGDIAKELGRRWADAEPEVKGKYEALADKDKARYEKEMTAYKKKLNPTVAPPVRAPPVPEVDDGEDEDEEIDDDEDE